MSASLEKCKLVFFRNSWDFSHWRLKLALPLQKPESCLSQSWTGVWWERSQPLLGLHVAWILRKLPQPSQGKSDQESCWFPTSGNQILCSQWSSLCRGLSEVWWVRWDHALPFPQWGEFLHSLKVSPPPVRQRSPCLLPPSPPSLLLFLSQPTDMNEQRFW